MLENFLCCFPLKDLKPRLGIVNVWDKDNLDQQVAGPRHNGAEPGLLGPVGHIEITVPDHNLDPIFQCRPKFLDFRDGRSVIRIHKHDIFAHRCFYSQAYSRAFAADWLLDDFGMLNRGGL